MIDKKIKGAPRQMKKSAVIEPMLKHALFISFLVHLNIVNKAQP